MTKVYGTSVKVYQRLMKRRGQVFCDGCGMLVNDGFYWSWSLFYVDRELNWKHIEGSTHLNPKCSGTFLLEAISRAPTEQPTE